MHISDLYNGGHFRSLHPSKTSSQSASTGSLYVCLDGRGKLSIVDRRNQNENSKTESQTGSGSTLLTTPTINPTTPP